MTTSASFLFVLGVLVFIHELGHFLLARWNGVSWSNLGDGISGPVYSMTVIGNDLYVGGLFTPNNGPLDRSNLARCRPAPPRE